MHDTVLESLAERIDRNEELLSGSLADAMKQRDHRGRLYDRDVDEPLEVAA